MCYGLHLVLSMSLFPPERKVAHNSKGAMQNCQMQAKYWPYITALSVKIAS